MTRIAFHTLGCKLNFAETSTYRRAFEAAGCDSVPWNQPADVYVLNTCAVTTVAEKKSRNLIRNVHRRAPEARIVVTGCYAELRADEIRAIDGVALVFGANEKSRLVPDTMAMLSASAPKVAPCSGTPLPSGPSAPSFATAPPSVSCVPASQELVSAGPLPASREVASSPLLSPQGDICPNGAVSGGGHARCTVLPSSATAAVLPAYSTGDRTRSFLKVQDGCDNFCAYCTVPYARGRSRNLPICEIVRQAREIAASGAKEVVLTGVNTGDFGRSTGESFLELLKALNAVNGIERYRISSIEPNLITEEIIDWIASGTKFLPHFHIPLQSGSDAVLRNVGRRYDTALFASRIDYIREKMGPHVFFGIDVIAGLPGETPERFEESFAFLRDRIRPAYLHVFPFSPRPGTRAYRMPEQVQDRIKTERVAQLEALCSELHAAFVASCKGLHETVLWESSEKDGKMEGYTGNYIRLERPFDAARIGTLEEIVL